MRRAVRRHLVRERRHRPRRHAERGDQELARAEGEARRADLLRQAVEIEPEIVAQHHEPEPALLVLEGVEDALGAGREAFSKALARVEVGPGWPADIIPYMQAQSEILVRENKIKAIPDWKVALRTEFLKQAGA